MMSGCAWQKTVKKSSQEVFYEDMTNNLKGAIETLPGKIYRLWETGICGFVESDHIKVTHVISGSVADGKIKPGDLVRGMQKRSMNSRGSVAETARLRLFRIGRDYNWHFYVTVERPSLRDGKGNNLIYDLQLPPIPGNICHYGPTGFFAERHQDHLLISIIEKGSPSDGKLMKGDKIIAVNGEAITQDAYHQFTTAVDRAESSEGKGILTLKVQRSGNLLKGSTAFSPPKNHKPVLYATPEPTISGNQLKRQEHTVKLTLKTLGDYSDTAPRNCKKTKALISQTADYLVKTGNIGKLNWGLLGLLATGEEKYIEHVRQRLHDPKSWAKPPEDPKKILKSSMYVSWYWGYQNLLLTEYYLLTGDKYVLPTITQLSRSLAVGQDQAGLWGHRMANPESGRAFGYGVMNQPTMPIFISLILAEKCGIKDDLVRKAIERTHAHYDKWIGRGALPYGNHGPGADKFSNNGTSGSLAVAFALLGNNRGAKFYGAMSAADSDKILLGHGGPVWNILWSGLGTNVLGPDVTAAYNKKLHELRTVTRTWNGRYLEMKGWGSSPGSGSWETGCYLLNLCATRRAISITGKGMSPSLFLKGKEAKNIVNMGDVDSSSNQTLLDALGNPFPPVQTRAASALAMKNAEVSSEVLTLLANGTLHQRIGAIFAIQKLKIESTLSPLLSIALDEKDDLWLRILAVNTLGTIEGAKPHASQLLKMLVKDKKYDQPYGELDLALGKALVKMYAPNPYDTELDKDLFYRGISKLLNHKHGIGRGSGIELLKNVPKEDLPRVIKMMVYLFEFKDKSYTFYPGKGRQEVLEILYHHGIKESMDYTVDTLNQGRNWQRRSRLRLLQTFGGEAKYLIPRIKELLGDKAEDIVKKIEASPSTKEMISIDEFLKASQHKAK